MNSNIATAAFLIFCILLFGFGMNSCTSDVAQNRFAYTRNDFDAEIEGVIDGEKVEASIKHRPHAQQGEYHFTLSYKSPSALSGLVLTQNNSGECEARLGELIMHNFKADGLIEPFLTLLYFGEINSVRRNNSGEIVICVQNENYDLEYTFPEGYSYPYTIKGQVGERNIELFVQRLDFVL